MEVKNPPLVDCRLLNNEFFCGKGALPCAAIGTMIFSYNRAICFRIVDYENLTRFNRHRVVVVRQDIAGCSVVLEIVICVFQAPEFPALVVRQNCG